MLQYGVSSGIGTPSPQTQVPQYYDYRPAAPKVMFLNFPKVVALIALMFFFQLRLSCLDVAIQTLLYVF